MTKNHTFEHGDEIRVRIPAGWWDPLNPASYFPFAEKDEEDLLVRGRIVRFSASEESDVEDTAHIETIRGEVHGVLLTWIIGLENLEDAHGQEQ